MLAFITGSGLYGFDGLEETTVSTRFGNAQVSKGNVGGREILLLSRHGVGHKNLPHHINHRANILALKSSGATAIVSMSVCGLLRADWSTGMPMLADDLFFPENRLGDGSTCSIFDIPGEAGRGHLIAGSLFDSELQEAILRTWHSHALNVYRGTYAHVLGPRFNTKSEINILQSVGADFLSQTCGPEAVLANELEIPFALAAFGIDHANGIVTEPTSMEILNKNLAASAEAFKLLIETLPANCSDVVFKNFVYRFE